MYVCKRCCTARNTEISTGVNNRAHPKLFLSQYSSLLIPVSFSCSYFDACNSFSDGPKLLFSCCSNNIFIIRTGNHCLTLMLMLSMYFSDILLKCIIFLLQGMDPITRQVGQHIEMEPEWEAAFTLQMKLTLVISMIQDWCALDVSSF